MNTKIFFKSAVALAIAATALTGCDENAWNNKLEGFEEKNDEPLTIQQTVDYTLTDANYVSIAGYSDNKTLAGTDLASALAKVGTSHAFSTDIPASKYAPAFLASTDFPYFSLDNGSAVRLTYKTQVSLPASLAAMEEAQSYTVTSEDYQEFVWESDDNYIDAFAPSHKASRYMNKILNNGVDLGDGEYCLVSYAEATQEPVFGNVDGGESSEWEMGSTIGDATVGATIEAKAVVTAICAQGYIATDKSGSILVYYGKTFDTTSVKVGSQLNLSGTISSYGTALQVVGSSATVDVVGEQSVTYPEPKVMSGAEVQEAVGRSTNELAQYVQIKGTPTVGSYINITIDGATTAQGSVYQGTAEQKAAFTDGLESTVTGYFVSVSSGKYFNMIVTAVNGKACAPRVVKAPVVDVPTETVYELYHYSSGAWSAVSDIYTLTPADYTAMGQSYYNLTDPETYLPIFLKQKYPYAQADDVQNILYTYYSNSTSSLAVSQYMYDGSEWVLQAGNGAVTVTSQFVKTNGTWMYDPSVVITLPAGRNVEISTTYYQACVDWVYANICQPLGDTSIKSGKFYVTSYGNNEYYAGTSAYQGNLDLRPDKAIDQYAAGYENMTNDEVLELEKKRFMEEVMPGALATLHPDARPEDGVQVTYTINFSVYGYLDANGNLTGTVGSASTSSYTAVFEVVGQGKFAPVSCTWKKADGAAY